MSKEREMPMIDSDPLDPRWADGLIESQRKWRRSMDRANRGAEVIFFGSLVVLVLLYYSHVVGLLRGVF